MKVNRTVLRATQILKLVSAYPDGLTLSEIVSELKMPKASAHDIIKTLCFSHLLRETGKRYAIGLMAKELGDTYLQEKDLFGITQPVLKDLAERYKLTASLVLFNSSHLEFLSRYTPSGVIHASASGSGAEGLHASASAKALIAHMSPAKKQRIINMITFTPYTPKTITTIGAFEKELEEVRKKGFALDKGEFNELLSCVSAPVLLKGRAVAAITLSGIKLEKRLLQPMSKELIVRSRQVAHSLSQGIN